MTATPATPSSEQTGEVTSLVRALGTANQRLEELTAGEIDAVTGKDGRVYVLQHAQNRLLAADASQRATILEALPAHIALLDPCGFIVVVNSKWCGFAEANAPDVPQGGVGLDYAAICAQVHGFDPEVARDVAAGVASVLAGRTTSFETEYRRDFPGGENWRLLNVSPVRGDPRHGAVVMHLDITAHKRAEEDLRRFASALDATADAIFLVDRASMRYIHVNDAACRLHGKTSEQLIALGPGQITGKSSAEMEREYDALIAEGGSLQSQEFPHNGPPGSPLWIEVRRHAHRLGTRWTIVVVIRDITERKHTERRIGQLNRLYAVLSGINSLIVRARDRDELFTGACRIAVELGAFSMAWIGVVNPSTQDGEVVASFGIDESYLRQISFTLRDDVPDSSKMASRALRNAAPVICNDFASDPSILSREDLLSRGHRSLGCFPLTVGGRTQAIVALYASEPDIFDQSEMRLLNEMSGDISFALDHIARQNQLVYLAYHDELTGLANRRLFCDRAQQHIQRAMNDQCGFGVFLLDLERFKNINQSLGRPAGDLLLQLVAQWLKRYVGDTSLLARVGADQFAIMWPREPLNKGFVARVLEKALASFLAHPFKLNDVIYRMAAKIGVAPLSDGAADAETLLTRAEAALKEAKVRGQPYMSYSLGMTDAAATKFKLETQLRNALERQEFTLHYQPKLNLATGRLTGAEALLRWSSPEKGLIAPDVFIPILEESKLIVDVGRWVLRRAIEDYLRWRAAGFEDVRIAVNVSPLQLQHPEFIADITDAVGKDGRYACGLELEITESVIMEDAEHSIATLTAIRALGVHVAVDDFGTGFSSLSYLAKLPLDSLKIDRSFVTDMTATPEGLTLVSSIINLAHSLGLSVVAEGVETTEQSQLLRSLKCNEAQGYLFGRPTTSQKFEAQYLTPLLRAPGADPLQSASSPCMQN